MYAVSVCLCSISWDGKKLWICIKQSATHRWLAWLVLLLWTTAPDKCFLPLSYSREQGSEGEKENNLMGTLFCFTLWMKNQHTNDADSHAKKHKTMVAHTQADTRRYKDIPPTTHPKDKPPHQTVCKHFFFSKCISWEYSALLSNSF